MMGDRRWLLVGLLFQATPLNYLDRQTLSVSSSLAFVLYSSRPASRRRHRTSRG